MMYRSSGMLRLDLPARDLGKVSRVVVKESPCVSRTIVRWVPSTIELGGH